MTDGKKEAMRIVRGHVEPAFAPVSDLLEHQFAKGEHIGAGVCVYHRGRKVVDIWGGLADEDAGKPWQPGTLALSYSTTKGLTATCLHILADRGLVDYAAPVARYWPEFAQNGKEQITGTRCSPTRLGCRRCLRVCTATTCLIGSV